jgi:putative selenium metabolism protein SsnA
MLITNANVITWGEPNQILEDHAIYIKGNLISDIGPTKALSKHYQTSKILDARGQYIMPGNICAHTHFYGAYARGMAIPGKAPKDFPEILQKLWWPLDKALDEESVKLSAFIHLIDAIKHGTTTIIDHHASPNFIDGSLDVIAKAVDKSGLRAVLCYEVTDRDGKEKAQAGIRENVRFIKRTQQRAIAGGRVSATFGMHASLTLNNKTLEACRSAAPNDTGFHLHVAEHHVDEYHSLGKSGMRVVNRLNKYDLLGPKSILAHGVHIDMAEANLISETQTWLTHQPRSNMNNAVGIPRVEELLRNGVRVALGNDGFSQTHWEEMKFTYLVHKLQHLDPRRMNGMDVVQIAVYNNAALASSFFSPAPLGVLAPGAHADLIFVDYKPNTPCTAGNLPWHILFGFHESMVTTTMVAGKIIMQDRKILTLDEEALTARARELAPSVWRRYEEFAKAARRRKMI